MPSPISLSETQIFAALGNVLDGMGLASTSADCPVAIVRGQVNRVPEPKASDFVVMWPLLRGRLATNIDDYFDNQFTGSIVGNTLILTALIIGAPTPGAALYGPTVAPGCQIRAQLSGLPGGPGTYALTATPNVAAGTLYCGLKTALQETEFTVQLDVHGPASGDNAQRISTLFRDQFGVDAFAAEGVALSPLYTSDPRQAPFENAEQQIEERWIIDVHIQADISITTTMQFATRLQVTTTPVESLS